MNGTSRDAEDKVLNRMCKAIGRSFQLESKEAKELAKKWARAWHDEYVKLSSMSHVEPDVMNRD